MNRVRGVDELEDLWRAAPPSPRGRGTVRIICVRLGDQVHDTPERVEVSPEGGVSGDRWAAGKRPDPACQVTLMSARVAELVAAGRVPLSTSGDNFIVDLDLSHEALPAGARLRLGGAVLEVSHQVHTPCWKFRQRFGLGAFLWVNDRAHAERRLRGVNCRVLVAGQVAVGDPIELLSGTETEAGRAARREEPA